LKDQAFAQLHGGAGEMRSEEMKDGKVADDVDEAGDEREDQRDENFGAVLVDEAGVEQGSLAGEQKARCGRDGESNRSSRRKDKTMRGQDTA